MIYVRFTTIHYFAFLFAIVTTTVQGNILESIGTCNVWDDVYRESMETHDCVYKYGNVKSMVNGDEYRYWCYTKSDITVDATYDPKRRHNTTPDIGHIVLHYHNHLSDGATDMKVMVQCANSKGDKLVSRIFDCWSKAHSMQRFSHSLKLTQVGQTMAESCVATPSNPIKILQITKWWT